MIIIKILNTQCTVKPMKKHKIFVTIYIIIRKKWRTGESYLTRTNYQIYEENTVYYFNQGSFGSLDMAKEFNNIILKMGGFYKNK